DTTTTYILTAQNGAGVQTTGQVVVQVGPPRVKIVEVQFTSVNLKRGETVGICYEVRNARSVVVEPVHFRAGSLPKGCTTHKPLQNTTYPVTAVGESGDSDQEKVLVTVH